MKSRHVPFPVTPLPSAAGGSRRLVRGLAGLFAGIVLVAMLASACSASSQTTAATTTGRPYATTAAATTAAGINKGSAPAATTIPPGYPTGTTVPGSGTRPSEFAVKIIRNATLELEAKNAEQAYRSLLAYASERGGYEASYRLAASAGGALVEARIKIAPKYLDDFLSFAGTAARVVSATTASQDVTESYYDVETRLRTLEQMLTKYTEFLGKAATISEALSVQSEINRLTTEIEALKGKLRYYDSMVAESTITLTIRQEQAPDIIKEEIKEIQWNALTVEDMGKLMQRGFMTVVNSLTSILQWLAIALVAVSPLLLIALAVLLIVMFRRRRHPRPPHGPGQGGWKPGQGTPPQPAGPNGGPATTSGSAPDRFVPVERWGRAGQRGPSAPAAQPAKPDVPPAKPDVPEEIASRPANPELPGQPAGPDQPEAPPLRPEPELPEQPDGVELPDQSGTSELPDGARPELTGESSPAESPDKPRTPEMPDRER